MIKLIFKTFFLLMLYSIVFTQALGGDLVFDDNDADKIGNWVFIDYNNTQHGEGVHYTAKGDGSNTVTWNLSIPESKYYRVSVKAPSYFLLATDAPFTINHANGSDTQPINQAIYGGIWRDLGVYYFNKGESHSIQLSNNAINYAVADAVKLEPVNQEIIIDDNKAAFTGNWIFLDYNDTQYGEGLHYTSKGDGSSTATWELPITTHGEYEVSVRSPASLLIASDANFTVKHANGEDNHSINQKTRSGEWKVLGTYKFTSINSAQVVLNNFASSYVVADAVRLLSLDNSSIPPTTDISLPEPSSELINIFPYKPPVEKKKRTPHKKLARTTLIEREYKEKIIIKFIEGQKIRLRDYELVNLNEELNSDVEAELDELNFLFLAKETRPHPLFSGDEEKIEKQRIKGELLAHKELADLNNYYEIIPNNIDIESMESYVNTINAFNIIEIAYVPSVNTPTLFTRYNKSKSIKKVSGDCSSEIESCSYIHLQGYLDDINIHWAWETPPYNTHIRGKGIRLADIEHMWNIEHEDLGLTSDNLLGISVDDIVEALKPSLFNNNHLLANIYSQHGTNVLGELIGLDNGYGIVGIANEIDVKLVSTYQREISIAINEAIPELEYGDIILIELATSYGTANLKSVNCNGEDLIIHLPVEINGDSFDAISIATALGIVVVEAAGNAGQNLDEILTDKEGNLIDSEAIIVGAGDSLTHNPLCFSNYGSRVDLYSWGNNVTTTGKVLYFTNNGNDFDEIKEAEENLSIVKNKEYTNIFKGTSSATPIVSGVAAVINGYYTATINSIGNGNTPKRNIEDSRYGRVLHSKAMRVFLKNTGGMQGMQNEYDVDGEDLHLIGQSPNTKAALEAGLPIASIKANNQKRSVYFLNTDEIEVTAHLNAGGLYGNNAQLDVDWWIMAEVNTNIFYLKTIPEDKDNGTPERVEWTTTLSPIYQGNIVNLDTFTIFKGKLPVLNGLSTTKYTVTFGIDTRQNGNIEHELNKDKDENDVCDNNEECISEIENDLFFDSIEINVSLTLPH